MKKIRAVIFALTRLIMTLRINSLKVINFQLDNETRYIIWVPFIGRILYLGGDNFAKDMAIASALSKRNKKYALVPSLEGIDLSNKVVLFSTSTLYNQFNFEDYSASFRFCATEIARRAKRVYPSVHEANLWENKIYMHEFLDEKAITTPQTILTTIEASSYKTICEQLQATSFLLKEPHSCSADGVHKIAGQDDYDDLVHGRMNGRIQSKVIFQELINMRKDLRVIFVGNEIVLYYWRINKSIEWRPTSTGLGSDVDFNFFPEQWRALISSYFERLDITSGAFDICWQNDDLSTEPLILEISSFYQPNPKWSDNEAKKFDYYGVWKKTISFRQSGYPYRHIAQLSDIQDKIIEQILSKE